MGDEKRCPKCETLKSVEDFYRLKSGPRKGWIQGYCKACTNAERRRRYLASPEQQERQREHAARWYQENKERASASRKEYYARTKSARARTGRDWRFREKYGITHDDYDAMVSAQGGLCAACGGEQQHGWKRLCVDHDHATGRVRGLLCDYCNRAVGLLRDDASRAQRLADYLSRVPIEGLAS